MIQAQCASLNFRPFVDSAPILERPLAEKAGLGWTGKHSLILSRDAGSFFSSASYLSTSLSPSTNPSRNSAGAAWPA